MNIPSLTELFPLVLRSSCLGGVAILLLLGPRFFAGQTLSPFLRSWLWLPVALLFLLPRVPNLGWQTQRDLLPGVVKKVFEPGTAQSPVAVRETAESNAPLHAAPQTSAAVSSVPLSWSLRDWALCIWISGTLALAMLWLAAHMLLLRRVRRGQKMAPDSVRHLLGVCARDAGLKRMPHLIVTDALDNPAVAGLLRPMVLVPERLPTVLSESELRLVLQHEVWHIRRRDLWLHWFSALLLAVHWFNPLLWIAARLFRADREAACDAAVLGSSDKDMRHLYGETLLKLQARMVRAFSLRPMIGVLGGADLLKQRIVDIANFGHSGSRLRAGLVLAMVCLGAAGLAVLAGESAHPARGPGRIWAAEAAPDPFSSAGKSQREKEEQTLQAIDRLAGVVPRQIHLSSKIISFDAAKVHSHPQDWFNIGNGEKAKRANDARPMPKLELVGSLSDPQYQVILREMARHSLPQHADQPAPAKGNEEHLVLPVSDEFKAAMETANPTLRSAPSVTTRSGQKACVEIVREFIYPTAFERKEAEEPGGNPKLVPSAFSMEPLGIRVEMEPKIFLPNLSIDLRVSPKISAFLKWQEFKAADGQFLRTPIFGSSAGDCSVTISDGQTLVFAGHVYQAAFANGSKDWNTDPPPGDALCPAVIFVTAKLISPDGKPVKPGVEENRGVVIPTLKLSDATLANAVEQICDLARKNDPRGKGVNVILRQPTAEMPRITLSASDVTISQVLHLLATTAHLELAVQDETVVLKPMGQEQAITTPKVFRKVPFTVGPQKFLKDDSIEILEVSCTSDRFEPGDLVVVKGRGHLGSHDSAKLALYLSETESDGRGLTEASQETKVETRNTYMFELSCTIQRKGFLHVSYYDLKTREGFGSVYFGTESQMKAFRDLGN